MTPELLAALAQVESTGNSAARTYWRWRWTLDPFQVFAPASSAVGLLQMTDGAFERCRRLCVRGGKVEVQRDWFDPRGCWFNGFYNRLIPADSVELTSACLQSETEALFRERGLSDAPLRRKQDVAVASHLCGPRAKAVERLLSGRPVPAGWRCGDHEARAYLSKVRSLSTVFARLRTEGSWKD